MTKTVSTKIDGQRGRAANHRCRYGMGLKNMGCIEEFMEKRKEKSWDAYLVIDIKRKNRQGRNMEEAIDSKNGICYDVPV